MTGNTEQNLWTERLQEASNLLSGGQYQEAVEVADKAIELAPQDARAYFAKAEALRFLDRYEEAIDVADKAIELDPRDPFVYGTKAAAHIGLGNLSEAKQCVKRALELDPDYAWAPTLRRSSD